MGCRIETWSAKLEADRLTVIGTGECTQRRTFSLEPTNEGIVDEPDLISTATADREPAIGTTSHYAGPG